MKKVLSFVLVLALVLSSFSMAFAGSATELKTLSDIDGNFNQEAIEVNYDLGIVTGNPDGTFQPEKAVTRAEFAAMITRALAIPQSALAGYANTSFKDTAGYSWAVPYLAFCNSKGIMLGDGAGNAMPGKTITVNEAVTMSLRAIGYVANSSELVGVWPSNYVTKAQELKMYDDVAKDALGVDKANAAQIIYNTLTVQKVAVNSDGKTDKLWADNEKDSNGNYVNPSNLLNAGLNCELFADEIVGFTGPNTDDAVINIAKHFGKHGDIYTNDDDEIVAFISDSDQLTGIFNDEGNFTTTADGKEYNFNSSLTIAAITKDNMKTQITAGTATASALLNSDSYGYNQVNGVTEVTLNVDLSGKTIKEIYSAVQWKVNGGEKVEADDLDRMIEDQRLLGFDFILDDNDEIDYTQFQLVGAKSIKDIKADNIVYVYASDKDIKKIEVGTEVAEGLVKSFKNAKSDVATSFAIGANTYKNAQQVINGADTFSDADSVSDKEVAETVKAFLDARGLVFDFESTDSIDNYAVASDMGTLFNKDVKVMLADGSEKVLKMEEKDDWNALTKGAVFGYSLNKDGEIASIDQTVATGSASNIMIKIGATYTTGATITLDSNKVVKYTTKGSLGGSVYSATVAKDVVVFTYDAVDDEYDVTTIDKVDKASDSKNIDGALLFAEDDRTEVVAMIVDSTKAKAGDKSYAVLNDRDLGSNVDEDKVWKVVGFKDGEPLDAMTDDDSNSLFKGWKTPDYATGTGFRNVFLYEVKTDANGVITSADTITAGAIKTTESAIGTLKAADGKNSVTFDGTKGSSAEDLEYTVGAANTVYALSDKVVMYEVDGDEYRSYKGSLKKGDYVRLYEIDDDEDGFDVVIFARP